MPSPKLNGKFDSLMTSFDGEIEKRVKKMIILSKQHHVRLGQIIPVIMIHFILTVAVVQT